MKLDIGSEWRQKSNPSKVVEVVNVPMDGTNRVMLGKAGMPNGLVKKRLDVFLRDYEPERESRQAELF